MITTATIPITTGIIIPGGARGTGHGSAHCTDPGTGTITGTCPCTVTLISDTIPGTGPAGPTIHGITIPGTGPGSGTVFIADGMETDGMIHFIAMISGPIQHTGTTSGVMIPAAI